MIQPTDYEPTMPAPCSCTTGGNTALRNGDDDNSPAADCGHLSVRRAVGMLAEDDSYCQGPYRKSDV